MLLDFKNCLKRFTFWLITSVGKNNYCHMVCGLGFRRIKSLLLPIVLCSHLLPISKNWSCRIESPKFATSLNLGSSVNLASNCSLWEQYRNLFNSVYLNGLIEPVPKAHASWGFVTGGPEIAFGSHGLSWDLSRDEPGYCLRPRLQSQGDLGCYLISCKMMGLELYFSRA